MGCRRSGGTKGAQLEQGIMIFLRERKRESSTRNRFFFVHRRLVSAVKRIEFVSDRLSYIVLRGRWLHIILVNVRAPSEEKSEVLKDSFYEESEEVFDHFPKYHRKILLRDFNAKVGRGYFQANNWTGESPSG